MSTKDAIPKAKPKTSAKAKPKAKPKAKSKRGPGRPKVVIDWKQVDAYLKAGCSGAGIAGMLGISDETLYRACERDNKVGFVVYSQSLRAVGDDMLRAKQFDLAMKGSENMLKHLGRHRLGQVEKREPEGGNGQSGTPQNITFTITEELIESSDYDTEEKTNETATSGETDDSNGDQLQGEPES